jgi:chloramphenicol O-acetyltransferase type A
VPVDVNGLRERAAVHGATPWLAYHHAALEAANEIDAMRQTLKPDGSGVREFETIHASTTVLRDDGSFGFAYLDWVDDFAAFARAAQAEIEAVRDPAAGFAGGVRRACQAERRARAPGQRRPVRRRRAGRRS